MSIHGSQGWRQGCRCDVCHEWHDHSNAQRRANARVAADPSAVRDELMWHGSFGYKRGCRCTACAAWNRDRVRRQIQRRGGAPEYPVGKWEREHDAIDELVPIKNSRGIIVWVRPDRITASSDPLQES